MDVLVTTWSSILFSIALSLSLAASLLVLLNGRRRDKKAAGKDRQAPPSPPALLFLVKFLALRQSILHIGSLLRELHARHGPVISVRLFRTFVFVADRRVAHRVLVQGGSTFADRSPLVEPWALFLSGGIVTSPYGSYWRLLRRNLAAGVLHPARVALFAPERRRVCDELVRVLAAAGLGGDGPRRGAVTVKPLFRPAVVELLAYMSLGARLGPEALGEIQELHLRIIRCLAGFPVFSFFPALTKKLLFRKRWAEYVALRERRHEIFLPLIHARQGVVIGAEEDRPPCYADSLLALRVAEEGDRSLTDAEVVNMCSEFLIAGMDTTVCLLEWIMAELVNHPNMQAKVYEEAVRAQTAQRLSEGDDLRSSSSSATPYVRAVVLEGLRLHPTGQLLTPHGVHRDDAEIDGYAVPRGADVNVLFADFGVDEKVWAAPAREFRPERFLDGGEGCDMDITGSREIKMMPFGAGRRMCPGYSLSLLHLEYLVENLVREFQWLPPTDGEAVDMTDELNFTTDMKHPLRARIIQRNCSN